MHKILILPGDGIGPEIIAQAEKVLRALRDQFALAITVEYALIGGQAYDKHNTPLPEETMALARASDAVLLGAVGGPKWEQLERESRPERGLLGIRNALDLFANLRPVHLYPELMAASPLKPEVIEGLDILIVRELTGGIYFGEPRGIRQTSAQIQEGYNTMRYNETEITRIAQSAFQLANKRRGKLCSVDKANVLETSELWRAGFTRIAQDYPDIELQHMYVDNAAMQLVRAPTQFDVIATGNMFGDILSDLASMLTGSIGMLPSASLNHKQQGIYEPIHGSAPDIAGHDTANPLATILSLAMMLRYSLNEPHQATRIEQAVRSVLAKGWRTADICVAGQQAIGTDEMGDKVVAALCATPQNMD